MIKWLGRFGYVVYTFFRMSTLRILAGCATAPASRHLCQLANSPPTIVAVALYRLMAQPHGMAALANLKPGHLYEEPEVKGTTMELNEILSPHPHTRWEDAAHFIKDEGGMCWKQAHDLTIPQQQQLQRCDSGQFCLPLSNGGGHFQVYSGKAWLGEMEWQMGNLRQTFAYMYNAKGKCISLRELKLGAPMTILVGTGGDLDSLQMSDSMRDPYNILDDESARPLRLGVVIAMWGTIQAMFKK